MYNSNVKFVKAKYGWIAIFVLVAIFVVAIFAFRGQVLTFLIGGKPTAEEITAKLQEFRGLSQSEEGCEEIVKKAEQFLRRDSSVAEVWHWKGICEFEAGKFEEAKKSFEQVLSLDPERQSAKSYLKTLSDPEGLSIVETSESSRREFESLSKLEVPDEFTFEGMYISTASTAPQGKKMVTAKYSTVFDREQAVAEVQEMLVDANLEYVLEESEKVRTYIISNTPQAYIISNTPQAYFVTIDFNPNPTQITIRLSFEE